MNDFKHCKNMIELDLDVLDAALKKDGIYNVSKGPYAMSVFMNEIKMNVVMNFHVYNDSLTKTLKSYQTKIPLKGNIQSKGDLLGMMQIKHRVVWDDYLLVIANKFEQVMRSLTYN